MLRISFDHGMDGKIELSIDSEVVGVVDARLVFFSLRLMCYSDGVDWNKL